MYTHMFVYVAVGFSTAFLLIFLLQMVRIRKDRARSDEVTRQVAAVERFEEIFHISPYDENHKEIAVKIRTVVSGLGRLIVHDPGNYDTNRTLRLEALRLADYFGFHVRTAREIQEHQRATRKRERAARSRQTGGGTPGSAA